MLLYAAVILVFAAAMLLSATIVRHARRADRPEPVVDGAVDRPRPVEGEGFASLDALEDGEPRGPPLELVELDASGNPLSLNDLIHLRLTEHYAPSTPHSINDLLARFSVDNP
jgi:hypothetical protein